jgi:hypothetical protein
VIQVWGYGKTLCLFVCLFIFICLFMLENLQKKRSVILLIEHDYIATVVCILLVYLTSSTLHVIRNMNLLTNLLD